MLQKEEIYKVVNDPLFDSGAAMSKVLQQQYRSLFNYSERVFAAEPATDNMIREFLIDKMSSCDLAQLRLLGQLCLDCKSTGIGISNESGDIVEKLSEGEQKITSSTKQDGDQANMVIPQQESNTPPTSGALCAPEIRKPSMTDGNAEFVVGIDMPIPWIFDDGSYIGLNPIFIKGLQQ